MLNQYDDYPGCKPGNYKPKKMKYKAVLLGVLFLVLCFLYFLLNHVMIMS